MNRPPHRPQVLGAFGLVLACLLALFLAGLFSRNITPVGADSWQQGEATPTPSVTPTPRITVIPSITATVNLQCPPQPPGCSSKPARAYGYQPVRSDLWASFNDAASNNLGQSAPVYPTLRAGVPPNDFSVVISSDEPIPGVLLRAMDMQESGWVQFGDSTTAPGGVYSCTQVTGDCGYGIGMVTSGMDGSESWFTPTLVSQNLTYSLGTGVGWLLRKWNDMSNPSPWPMVIGAGDPTMPEDWYYAVTAYNGWSECNEPNRDYQWECGGEVVPKFDPWRSPYGEGDSYMPYQEIVWGWMAHPEEFHRPGEPPPRDSPLWRPTWTAWVPRGIWGLFGEGNWRPYSLTPQPVFTLLPDLHVENDTGPTILLHNTQGITLAADIALYNADKSFNRWWLGCPDDQTPSSWYIRVGPYETEPIELHQAFYYADTFSGYARVSAPAEVIVTLQQPATPPLPYHIFLPNVFCHFPPTGGSPTNILENGGFEEFSTGKPSAWSVDSGDNYPLADGTWFQSGHYGAYLGGYNGAWDVLDQSVTIPGDTLDASLTFSWYMETEESPCGGHYDGLLATLYDDNDQVIRQIIIDNCSDEGNWHTETIDIDGQAGRSVRFSLLAQTDVLSPTRFFVDDVMLWVIQ